MNIESSFYKELGKRVCQARKLKRMNQDELATQLGFNRTSITNIEKGRQKLSAFKIFVLANELNVHIDDLLPDFWEFKSAYLKHSQSKEISKSAHIMADLGMHNN